jgi:hypothetical protein
LTHLRIPDFDNWHNEQRKQEEVLFLASLTCPNLERPVYERFRPSHVRREAEMWDDFNPATWMCESLPRGLRDLSLEVWDEVPAVELRQLFHAPRAAGHLTLSLKISKSKPSELLDRAGDDDDDGNVSMKALRVHTGYDLVFARVWRSMSLAWCARARESLTRLKLDEVSMRIEAFKHFAFVNLERLVIVTLEIVVAGSDPDAAAAELSAFSEAINGLGRLRRLAIRRNCVVVPASAAAVASSGGDTTHRLIARKPRSGEDCRRRLHLELRHGGLRRLEVSWAKGWSVDMPLMLDVAECGQLRRFVGEQSWVRDRLGDLATWWPQLEHLTIIDPSASMEATSEAERGRALALLDLGGGLVPAVGGWRNLRALKIERNIDHSTTMAEESLVAGGGWTPLERLTSLALTGSAIGNDELVALLRGCTRLHRLEVKSCPNVTSVNRLASRSLAVLHATLDEDEDEVTLPGTCGSSLWLKLMALPLTVSYVVRVQDCPTWSS